MVCGRRMLRNLAKDRAYQVLLSTHDKTQSEFLRRKFAAASLPCTLLNLKGRGDTGVEVLIQKVGHGSEFSQDVIHGGTQSAV